jgi:hypothetical protein
VLFALRRVKCGGVDGNGATTKRTALHDLYEQQGQSPWYDNLCRPVTDLLPLISSGVRGVTSNPTVFSLFLSYSAFLTTGSRLEFKDLRFSFNLKDMV